MSARGQVTDSQTRVLSTPTSQKPNSGSPTWRPRSRRSPVRFAVSKATDDELWKILEEDCFEWSDQ